MEIFFDKMGAAGGLYKEKGIFSLRFTLFRKARFYKICIFAHVYK